jgi:YidC/Oxa1 family membrane protein insertase
MPNDNQRNTILFVVISLMLLFAYQAFVMDPAMKRRQALEAQQKAAATATQTPGSAMGPAAPQMAPGHLNRTEALQGTQRAPIRTSHLSGSISLKGGRIDDLYLTQYREGLSKSAPPVELLRPAGAEHAYFAEFGWVTQQPGLALPDRDTPWRLQSGDVLQPGKPVVLAWDNGQGLSFTRTISVDDRYLFTVADTVVNHGGQAVALAPYAAVQRHGVPEHHGRNSVVMEGAIGVLGPPDKRILTQVRYPKWEKSPPQVSPSTGGWLGLTDIYWLTALIPDQGETVTPQFRRTPGSEVTYDANLIGAVRQLAPGQQINGTTRLFAGAKSVPVLRDYEKSLGLSRFDDAVDWGRLSFLTRPIFLVLEWIFRFVGNFGLAILGLTVLVRLLFFPLQNKSYEAMTRMKKLSPEMQKIRERANGDQAKMQQEMMALYAREKISPLTGCLPILLPILIQLPVFLALYKVLSVSIEMRHAPFYGWIHDLSARDPTTLWNVFGLIPWNPAAIPALGSVLDGPLHLGVWPILMGFTMWLQQQMNPPTGVDPIQQKIFAFFPIILTFTLTNMAAGLVIYWTWGNVLSILQQYVIMRRLKVENPIDAFIAKSTGKPAPWERA